MKIHSKKAYNNAVALMEESKVPFSLTCFFFLADFEAQRRATAHTNLAGVITSEALWPPEKEPTQCPSQ